MSTPAPLERARELARESRFLTLCRVGLIARGLLYILIAGLALQTGRTEDFTGAFNYMNHGSGRALLMAIMVGLAAYGLWRLADGGLGIENRGDNRRARNRRLAATGIGFIYLYLAFEAARVLLIGRAGEVDPREASDTVLHLPGGAVILALIAIGLVAGGIGQLWSAKTCRFLEPLDPRALSSMVRWLGRIGYAARGVIFIVIGLLAAAAAIDARSSEAGGMQQALDLFDGPALFVMAAGLLLFGIFSIVEALYRHIPEPPAAAEIKRQVVKKLG